jgi:transposase
VDRLRLWWVIEQLVPDGLWERIASLLPPPKPRRSRYPGRRPIDDRAALAGIVFVLKTGIAWNQLPASLVGCSGVTCWRRLRDWSEAGVWPELHELLLAELRAAGELDLDGCAVDGSHIRALKGGTTSARRRSTAAAPAPSTI